MTSTVRVYLNEKRIATGRQWKDTFLQVYPEQKIFANEAEWRSSVYQSVLASIRFQTKTKTETTTKPMACSNDAASTPTPGPTLPAKTSNRKARIIPLSSDPGKWTHSERRAAILPAGTYYIGDLCYALTDSLYDKVFGCDYDDGLYTLTANPSHVFWLANTGGDGLFVGDDDKEYGVDAGILGIASESTLDPLKQPYHGGHMYTFTGPIKVSLKNECFHFTGQGTNDPDISIPLRTAEEFE